MGPLPWSPALAGKAVALDRTRAAKRMRQSVGWRAISDRPSGLASVDRGSIGGKLATLTTEIDAASGTRVISESTRSSLTCLDRVPLDTP